MYEAAETLPSFHNGFFILMCLTQGQAAASPDTDMEAGTRQFLLRRGRGGVDIEKGADAAPAPASPRPCSFSFFLCSI